MDSLESLNHSCWDCKYHVVFIPKCRRKTLFEKLRPHLGEVFRQFAKQKECRIVEGHLMVDHVHILISIPPKYAVAQVIGYIKGESAIHLARVYGESWRRHNYVNLQSSQAPFDLRWSAPGHKAEQTHRQRQLGLSLCRQARAFRRW